MVTRSSHRVSVRQCGEDKNLFSLKLEKKGDVYISIRTFSHSYTYNHPENDSIEGDLLREERFSVHPPRIEFGASIPTSTLNHHIFKNEHEEKPPGKKIIVDSFDNRSGFYFLQARFCPGLSGKKPR